MDEPIYYINHFSLLKRPAIYSKYEYWAANGISYCLLILLPFAWVSINDFPYLWVAIVVIATIPGLAFNFRKGRQRAERYKGESAVFAQLPYPRV